MIAWMKWIKQQSSRRWVISRSDALININLVFVELLFVLTPGIKNSGVILITFL